MQEDKREKAARLAEDILKLAQSTLMIKLRFLDMALSRFRLVPGGEGVGTDGEAVAYDPMHVLDLYRADRAAVNRLTLHMLTHCIAGHPFARADDRRLWDLSCDMAAENVVMEMDVSAEEAPEKSQKVSVLRHYAGKNGLMTAGRFYARLKQEELSESRLRELAELFARDSHALWPARADVPDESPLSAEARENASFWKRVAERIQTDLETSSVRYGDRAAALLQNLREVNRERQDYAEFLRRLAISGERTRLDSDEFDIVTYAYGMSLYKNMPIIEPLEYRDKKRVKDFAIVIDASDAVPDELARRFLEKTCRILLQQGSYFTRIVLHLVPAGDLAGGFTDVTDPEELRAFLETAPLPGAGGVDFRPAFAAAEELVRSGRAGRLQGLIYFTDGFGRYPVRQPDFPAAFVFLNDELADPRVPVWAIKLVLQSDEI